MTTLLYVICSIYGATQEVIRSLSKFLAVRVANFKVRDICDKFSYILIGFVS